MLSLINALSAETLKLKRTLALAMIFVAPLSVIFLIWLVVLRYRGTESNPWQLLSGNLLFIWAVLMMPLYITLETALLSGLDHNANALRHLYTLPIPRWTIYAAKQIVVLASVALSMVILGLGFWLMGMVTQLLHLKPDIDFTAPFPWAMMLDSLLLIYLATWLIISIHTWVAMRWPGLVVPIGIGMVAVVGAAIGANSTDLGAYYPWTIPATVLRQFTENGTIAAPSLVLGLVGGVIVAAVGCWHISRRDVS